MRKPRSCCSIAAVWTLRRGPSSGLPAHDARYKPNSLTDLRDEIAEAIDKSKVLSSRAKNYWNRLDSLFEIISLTIVGMPAYNGGLFERARAPLLALPSACPDSAMAAVIDSLSRRIEQIDKPRINYRDLSVAHLGGILRTPAGIFAG